MTDHEELKFYARHLGTVTDNAHPQKLGWVRVTVPGLLEPSSAWAFPVGGAHSSGAKGLGAYDVPPIGATVIVGFLSGDPDVPYYEGAPHGVGEQLSVGPSDPKDADRVKVFESERFLVVLNGISGSEQVLITDKQTGNKINMTPEKVSIVAPKVEIGADGTGDNPLVNGVVLASGVDTFTGATYGSLGSASLVVTSNKGL